MFLLLVFVLVASSTCEEIYENSTTICSKCKCSSSSDSLVFSLDCTGSNLHYILDSWPKSNATTISATFSKNNITTLATLPPTDAVVEVSFSECNIQFLYPGLFSDAKNTKLADFSHNLLTSEEVTKDKLVGPYNDSITEPVKLEILNLAYNRIHTLNKNLFDCLPDLRTLNLEGNDFKVLDIHTQLALSSLTNLANLNLANNELTELAKGALEGAKNLVQLDLSKNQLDFVPADLSMVGESLQVLIVDDNPILAFEPTTFTNVNRLLELSANNLKKLEEIPARSLLPLWNLKKLSLCNNTRLRTIDKEAFAPNLTLIELYLTDDNLTNIDYNILNWTTLHIFNFNENPLYCSCDLYNISSALSKDITKNENGPRCLDPSGRSVSVYELNSDICLRKHVFAFAASRDRYIHRHFSIQLAGLAVVLILAISVAITLAYSRYRKFLRTKNYPYASQVLYNPLSSTPGGRF